jgi:hypothetical protein
MLVSITLPIDAFNERDARRSCIDLLARAVALERHSVTQASCRKWIEENATIAMLPAPEPVENQK